MAKKEFAALKNPVVKKRFEPRREKEFFDPYPTAEDKYVAMRSAYYRPAWRCVGRDLMDKISDTSFFGIPVIGGTHPDLKTLLGAVEKELKDKPQATKEFGITSFSIDGFLPRFIAGTSDLSNHGCGLAIDVDAALNPQLKSKKTRQAFQLATGTDIAALLYDRPASVKVEVIYQRLKTMSDKLMAWLDANLPAYEQLQDLAKAHADPKGIQDVDKLEKKLQADRNLVAVDALVTEHGLRSVQAWRRRGIVTIPEAIVETFLRLGGPKARWGGDYKSFKDIMHLELLAPPRPKTFEDLVRERPPPPPNCGS